MKQYVSLLPSWYQKEQRQLKKLRTARRVLTVAAIALTVAFACTGAFGIYQSTQISALKHQSDEIQQQMSTLAQYEGVYEELTTLKGYEASVLADDPQWLNAVSDVAKVLPQGVWLEALSAQQQENGGRILNLECGANLHSDIARAITALENSDSIVSAYCSQSSENNGSVRFSLSVSLASAN